MNLAVSSLNVHASWSEDGLGVWSVVTRVRDARPGGAGKCIGLVCEVLGGMEMLGWLGTLPCRMIVMSTSG